MKRMNIKVKKRSYFVLCTLYFVISSCAKKDPNSPGTEFMPDMYRSPSLEVYSESSFFADSLNSRKPVEGTIPVNGYLPYPYPNDTAGYSAAGKYLKNPIELDDKVLKDAEKLYTQYCTHCHGAQGKGDGQLVTSGKFPGAPPAYSSGALKNLPEGKIFHTLNYGKGLMGSHASQLSQEERWKLVHYVQKLQHIDDMPVATVDSANTKN